MHKRKTMIFFEVLVLIACGAIGCTRSVADRCADLCRMGERCDSYVVGGLPSNVPGCTVGCIEAAQTDAMHLDKANVLVSAGCEYQQRTGKPYKFGAQ